MPCSYSSLVRCYGSGGVGVSGWSGCKGSNAAGACGIGHEGVTAGTRCNVPPHRHRWLSPLIVSLGVAAGPLDTAVNIAFPAITAAFGIPVTTIQWVVICYVLTYGSLLLGCGRLGDVIGHKRVFLFGLGWSAISLYLCGWAPTFAWLLFFRIMQGVGTALLLSCAPALVTLAFPEAERGTALGVYTMLSALASTLGPLLGGQFVALWGWPAVFYFRVPLALIAAVLTVFWVQQPVGVRPGQRFDSLGAVALTAAIAGLLLALNQGNRLGWSAPPTLLFAAGAWACLGFCIWYELRCAEPVIDLRLFRHTAFSIANMAHVLANIASFTVLLLVPYYLLNSYQASAFVGGVFLATAPLGTMLASPLGGWLLSRYASQHLSVWPMSGQCGVTGHQPVAGPHCDGADCRYARAAGVRSRLVSSRQYGLRDGRHSASPAGSSRESHDAHTHRRGGRWCHPRLFSPGTATIALHHAA